jgi:hypothetical protein
MSVWQHNYTKRLSKVEFDIFPIELHNSELDFFNDSIDMTDDEGSNHEDEFENQADQPVKSLRDYLQPTRSSTPSCVAILANTGNFDIKPGVVQLLPKFRGLDFENPYMHLKEFDMVCAMHLSNLDDVVKLILFLSWTEKARYWLHTLRPKTIGTWQEMTREFLKKFFPTHKTNTLRRSIMNFAMKENETFFQCWERFKELLLSCPHHGYETWQVISFFFFFL